MSFENPFIECPEFETEHFLICKVKSEDAKDLLDVYSDPLTKAHMNNDNCAGEWICHSLEHIQTGIEGWQSEYEEKFYIRWTVIDKHSSKGVGSIELTPAPSHLRFFDGTCTTGLLRLDLRSSYETEANFAELYKMTNNEMIELFAIEKIVTKAVDSVRIKGLNSSQYKILPDFELINYSNYFISYKW